VRALFRDNRKAGLLRSSADTYVGDVCDPQIVKQSIDGVDVVYHCAAAHSTASSEEIRQTTLPSLRCLLDAVRGVNPAPRLILMSSINVLGNDSFSNANEDHPRQLTGELHVDLKIEAEELAEQARKDGLDVVILRPGLIYGPGEANLPRLAKAIQNGRFVFIGSRDNITPLVHVSDIVEAMLLAGESRESIARTYNITDGSDTTIGELVSELARALNCVEPTRVLPKLVPRIANSVCGLLGKKGPVSSSALRFLGTSRQVDISRARNELDFNPRVHVTAGINSMADSLRTSVRTSAAA
jgi:nucleoside-diphosphate-sugar epimerase